MDILRSIGTRETPQHRRASAGQVPNSAGGYVFALDKVADRKSVV